VLSLARIDNAEFYRNLCSSINRKVQQPVSRPLGGLWKNRPRQSALALLLARPKIRATAKASSRAALRSTKRPLSEPSSTSCLSPPGKNHEGPGFQSLRDRLSLPLRPKTLWHLSEDIASTRNPRPFSTPAGPRGSFLFPIQAFFQAVSAVSLARPLSPAQQYSSFTEIFLSPAMEFGPPSPVVWRPKSKSLNPFKLV